MATVTSEDGTTIVFDKVGDGPAVILVTGATATRGSNAELVKLLSENFTVINYDRRGRGESGNNSPEASLDREVEDIAALIVEAGGSAALYGISSGGALVLEAAASGLNVSKVAVYEVPYSVDEDARERAREYGRNVAAAVAEGRDGDAADLFLGLVGLPPDMIAGMHHAPIWPDMVAVAPTLVFDAEALGFASRGGAMPEERIASITAPTLVLDGGATWPWMREVQQRIAKTLPNAEYGTLDDQTHDVSPAVLVPALTKFFG
jgi:pimeloyl-ACP methyl ester carboxylesterase